MSKTGHSVKWCKTASSCGNGIGNWSPQAPFNRSLFTPAACCKNARPGLPAPQIFMKSKFSWELFSVLYIKNRFRKMLNTASYTNTSAAGLSPQATSYQIVTSFILETSFISIRASLWRQKPPDFPTYRLLQPTKPREFNDYLPLPNKTTHNPAPTRWLCDLVSKGMERPWGPHIQPPSQHLSSSPWPPAVI